MATTQELEVAAWVAALVKELYEVEVGPATERDGKDDSGLTNDFTYERHPPHLGSPPSVSPVARRPVLPGEAGGSS